MEPIDQTAASPSLEIFNTFPVSALKFIPLWAEAGTTWSPRNPSNLKYIVILWFMMLLPTEKGNIIQMLLADNKNVLWIPGDQSVYNKITLSSRSELPTFIRQLCNSVSHNKWQRRLNITLLHGETKNTDPTMVFIYIVHSIFKNV